MTISELEIMFASLCDDADLPPYKPQYEFHAERKWALDFAWPDHKVGIEINGNQWVKGGHNTGRGVQRDAEKGNAARFLGWRIFVLVTDHLLRDVDYRNQFMDELKVALAPAGDLSPNPATLVIVPEHPTITVGPFTLLEQGLRIAATPTFEEFDSFGQVLKFFDRSIPWALGDWWNAAKAKFREEAVQLLDEHDVKLKSVQNKGAVCVKFPTSRRRDVLHFSHHEAVAGLEPPQQERFLDSAIERGWTVPQLRLAVRKWKRDKLADELFDDPRAVLGHNVEQLRVALTDLWGIAHIYPGMDLTLREMQNGIDGLVLFHDAVSGQVEERTAA